jgi:hypothetical protein
MKTDNVISRIKLVVYFSLLTATVFGFAQYFGYFETAKAEYCCSSDAQCERVTRDGRKQYCWTSSQQCSESRHGFCGVTP